MIAPAHLLADFEAAYADLVRYLAHTVTQGEQARDLAHDMWLRLAEAAELQPRHARGYLFGAARHLAIDQARRDRHHAELLADAGLRQAVQAPDVAERVGHRQALEAVSRALQALPDRTRDAFLAHRLDGTGQDELAQRHGVTRSTIERDIQRAQGQVRAALERWHGGAPAAADGSRRRSLAALLGVAGAAALPVLAWRLWQAPSAPWQVALATPRGRVDRHRLPDGSVLTLDADSACDMAFHATRREARLVRGGAFFDVAHDAARPFTVQAGQTQVVVLGTRFAVEWIERLAGAPAVRIAVESGRVQVRPRTPTGDAGDAIVLTPGEALHVEAGGRSVRWPASAGPAVAPWREGWLSFVRLPLGEAALRLARYRRQPLQVSPAVAALPVSGEVRIAQADEWLQLLPRLLPVRVRRAPDGAMVITPR